MPTRSEIGDRLSAATSAPTLLPHVQTGPVGRRVAASAADLRAQLAEPQLLDPLGVGEVMTSRSLVDIAHAVIDLTRSQQAAADVVFNPFSDDPDPVMEALQGPFLDVCFVAVMVLAATDLDVDAQLDDVIRTAASITPAGHLLRDLLGDPSRAPVPVDPPRGGLPGIPTKLLMTAEGLRRKGCAGAVKAAMQRWGAAVADQTPSYLEGAIDELDPPDGCEGEQMTIRGAGFGDGTRATVVFTGPDGHAVPCTPAQILSWTDTEVRVTIPEKARRGPVGILIFPGGGVTLADAAATAIGELGDCFGPQATLPLQNAAGRLVPPMFPPTPAPDGENLFTGGPPIVDLFASATSGTLWPGRRVELHWIVTGADAIEIVARDVAGSAPQELPAVPGPLPARQGSTTVTVPGTHPWRGEYVLRARNRCTAADPTKITQRALPLEMVHRRGLALGGGGSRGDFQAGALLYLYDVEGYRPDAIAGTSVGSINALELVMGDVAPPPPPPPAPPPPSPASRLASTWLALNTDRQMWNEETWLTHAKTTVRDYFRLFSYRMAFFPADQVCANLIGQGIVDIIDLKGLFENPRGRGVRALFNLDPIEARARATYDQGRTDASGIRLRMVAVSVETGDLVLIDEDGGLRPRGEAPTRPPTVPPAPAPDVVDGAIASAAMPGIFPARRLGDHMCVDGGVRDVIPVQIAVQDLGCNDVIAIRCSAAPEMRQTDPQRSLLEVSARSVLDITYSEVADDDAEPPGGFGEGVTVRVVAPTVNLHDPMVIEPGLIRIAMDYGWLRAADVLGTMPDRRGYASELSDAITLLRVQNWHHAWQANGMRKPLDPHRDFGALIAAGMSIPKQPEVIPAKSPEAIDAIRDNCRRIRTLLQQRLAIGAPAPPMAVRSSWFTGWERTTPPAGGTPWEAFVTTVTGGNRPAEPPPPPL